MITTKTEYYRLSTRAPGSKYRWPVNWVHGQVKPIDNIPPTIFTAKEKTFASECLDPAWSPRWQILSMPKAYRRPADVAPGGIN